MRITFAADPRKMLALLIAGACPVVAQDASAIEDAATSGADGQIAMPALTRHQAKLPDRHMSM